MLTDLEIAQNSPIKHISSIAASLSIASDELEFYGKYKAKLPLSLIHEEKAKQSKLILVSAITPTPAGEGKTTTSIGLTDALIRIGKKAIAVLREPSLGPVFGLKGGATGGGRAQVVPMEDINLHFTGDFAAVEKAHNLLAAMIDNSLQNKKNTHNLEPRTIRWKRVMDMNDRALRTIVVGLGGTGQGIPRETGFDITAASEVMAILCLSTSLEDLKERLGNIFVGMTRDKTPVYARDLKAHGAMALLLKDALKPNLVQTLDGSPVLLHLGPFANIAQGTNSLLATKMGLSLADYAVTEAGFGFDLGGEKFLHIKSMYGNLTPAVVVIVATIRALKFHGGISLTELKRPSVEAVMAGIGNLEKHLENVRRFGLTPVVAINKFYTDTDEELAALNERCRELGVACAVSNVWEKGGAGATELAALVAETAQSQTKPFIPLYDRTHSPTEKILRIATAIYGADSVVYHPKAVSDLKVIERLNLNHLPICMAKTQKSLSDNPNLLGRPKGFTVSIREIEIAAGAGFLIPIAGDMMRMPGLPEVPASEGMDIDPSGRITGLS